MLSLIKKLDWIGISTAVVLSVAIMVLLLAGTWRMYNTGHLSGGKYHVYCEKHGHIFDGTAINFRAYEDFVTFEAPDLGTQFIITRDCIARRITE